MCPTLTDEEKKEYFRLKEAFDAHFIGRQIIIHERANLTGDARKKGKTAKTFITAVHSLA